MQRAISLAISLIIAFSITITAFAAETSNTNEQTPSKTIVVGYADGIGTTIIDLNSITKKGYLYDLFNRLEDCSNYQFVFKGYENSQLVSEALAANEVQYIGPIMKTESRESQYLYSLELNNAVVSLVVKEDGKKYYYDDFAWIDGKTVASYENSQLEKYLDEYCEKKNISVNYVRGTSDKYQNLDADLYLTSSTFQQFSEYRSVLNLNTYPLYMATSHQNAELNEEVVDIFEQAIADDVDFIYELHEKYYGNSNDQRRYLTREEVELLQNRTFKVAFESNHEFFSYINENGEPDGLLINLFNFAAEKSGIVDFEYLPYQINGEGENSVEYAVENADFVLSSLGKYKDFNDDFSLTDTYTNIPLTLVVNENLYYGNKTQDEPIMGILRNMFLAPEATKGLLLNENYNIYDNPKQLISDFDSGLIDGFLLAECALGTASAHINRKFYNTTTEASTPMKLWVSNRLGEDYIRLINVILDHLDYSKIKELIVQEQAKKIKTPTLMDTVMNHKGLFASISGLFILLIIILLQQRISRKKEQYLLEVDSLTGLMSKYKFEKMAKYILNNAKPCEYLLVNIDINNFKNLNKIYGYKIGDALLRALGESLSEHITDDDLIGRMRDDHFIVLLRYTNSEALSPNELSENQIKQYKLSLQNYVKNTFEEKIKSLGVTTAIYFSIGVYIIENPTAKLDFMLDCTKIAKQNKKNIYGHTVTIFTKELKQKQEKDEFILSTMEKAIENEEFFIVIQPKIDLHTEKIIGGEVLVRWKKNDGSYIYPDEFIPLFEKNDFIVKLDHYVLEKTCDFIYNSDANMLPILSVNVSASTMLQSDFISEYLEILNRYDVSPHQLEIELTESVLDFDFEYISQTFKKLRKLGFSLAIDDFGVGASSLARIKEIRADVIKLDKGFLYDNSEEEKGKIVIEKIISMANDLGFVTLAEGIETQESLDLLKELSCDFGQGYFFYKPLSTDEFREKVYEDANRRKNET